MGALGIMDVAWVHLLEHPESLLAKPNSHLQKYEHNQPLVNTIRVNTKILHKNQINLKKANSK